MGQERFPEFPPSYKIHRMPRDVVQRQRRHPLLSDLFITRAGYFPQASGHEMERETIDEYIIIYCVAGRGWFRSNGKRSLITKGEVAFVLPNTAHGYGAASEEPWTIQWAHFDGKQVSSLLELADISLDRPVIAIGERLKIVSLFNEILQMLQSGYSLHYLLNAAACLRQILSNIALLNSFSPPTGVKDLNVERIIQFMLDHLADQHKLDDFAAQANLSPSHFSRRFRQKTGYAPIDYYIRLKIQKACELLETTDMKVGEISRSLGYKDQYYFSRIFKKIIGTSPSRYRASLEL